MTTIPGVTRGHKLCAALRLILGEHVPFTVRHDAKSPNPPWTKRTSRVLTVSVYFRNKREMDEWAEQIIKASEEGQG